MVNPPFQSLDYATPPPATRAAGRTRRLAAVCFGGLAIPFSVAFLMASVASFLEAFRTYTDRNEAFLDSAACFAIGGVSVVAAFRWGRWFWRKAA